MPELVACSVLDSRNEQWPRLPHDISWGFLFLSPCIFYTFYRNRFKTIVAAHLLTEKMRTGEESERRAEKPIHKGRGTAMTIHTADNIEEPTDLNRIASEVSLAGRETILFVEDEAFVREVTCEVLRSAGYRVLSAKNAVEAERVYDQSSGEVELLLADVVLPGETGRTLGARLRRKRSALKVLLVTGYGEQMGLREGSQDQCLAKPFSSEVLLLTVRQRLDCEELRMEPEI